MSYARLTEKEKVLAAEVSDLLAQADSTDTAEDERFGKTKRGEELPDELARRESRLSMLRKAKAALEAEAAEAAAEHAVELARRKGADEQVVAERAKAASDAAVPKPKAQRNFTDPDSKIMLTGRGSFEQSYNAQAVVDADHQVIVAADLHDCASDVVSLIPMAEQTKTNTGRDSQGESRRRRIVPLVVAVAVYRTRRPVPVDAPPVVAVPALVLRAPVPFCRA
jgi:hypothetical protein